LFAEVAAHNPTFYAELAEPQSLNKYSYGLNNPLKFVDPDGHQATMADALRQGMAAPGPPWVKAGIIVGGVLAVSYETLKETDWRQVARELGKTGGGCLSSPCPYWIYNKATNEPKEVVIDGNKYPESAQHVEDAQKAGQPSVLTVDRGGAKNNRKESLKGTNKVQGKDRDEYPPAVTKEGGKGASIRPITPSDNRGAGSSIGHQIKNVPDGGKIKVVVKHPKDDKPK
jgi:hypothetical protein